MQLGDPSVLETSADGAMMAAVTATAPPEEAAAASAAANGGTEIEMMNHVVNMDAANSGDDIEKRSGGGGGGGGAGNRWPRQETFALLKIRSDMDAAFRDSSLKGPLWEQVSRKMAELGYDRSAKKCKEKFENVYKYHKRTKESRSGKQEGKAYKFFDQLQALENQFTVSHIPRQPPPPPPQPQQQPSSQMPTISYVTVPSTINPTLISPSAPPPPPPANIATTITNPRSFPNINFFSTTTTTSTSSSTASDEDMEEKYRKKRKLKEYFRRLTRQVLAKQEEMQKRFLEAMDKRERERSAQQEAWRVEEMARINKEHDILIQERSAATTKDATVIAFLQKLSGGQQNPAPPPPPNPWAPPQPKPITQVVQVQPREQLQLLPVDNYFENQKANITNGHQVRSASSSFSSSRWPKAEVHALIRLRTSMDPKYQENGPKGPLWEDISAGMQRLGYNRSAKRCKEKWENINKYFKKVKESNKQRREHSKTCPYFQELDALYREKSKTQNYNPFCANNKPNHEMLMEPLMVQPEQQWRPPPLQVEGEGGAGARENADNVVQFDVKGEGRLEGEDEEEEEDDMEEDGDSGEDDQGGRYEIAATNPKLPSVDTVE